MKYRVTVVDRDYHTVTDVYYLDFVNEDEAKRYAKNESWTGEDYFVDKVEDENVS